MPILRKLLIIKWFRAFLLLAFPLFSYAGVLPENITKPDSLAELRGFLMHQKNYIPGQQLNQSIKTIYIAVNIWQDDEGGNNLPEEDYVKEHIEQIFVWLNRFFSYNTMPSAPIIGVDYLRDSHIRFELKEISYFQNSRLNKVGCNEGHRLNQSVFSKFPHKQQYLNLHFTMGNCRGASGYANYPESGNRETDAYVVSYMKPNWEDYNDYPYWALMLHLAHELGHNMDLRHPYDSEYCSATHPDFLFDLFGYDTQEWCTNPRPSCNICYHQGGWDCDLNDPNTTCTNNIMGGNRNSGSITPLQMGRMHRALALKSVGKYAWGYSDQPFVVDNDQVWNLTMKLFQNIVVKSGSTLLITGKVEMVPQAGIILEPGARLIVDGGSIQTALYAETPWQGIQILPATHNRLQFWKKRISEAEVVVLNGGWVEL